MSKALNIIGWILVTVGFTVIAFAGGMLGGLSVLYYLANHA
jgi:hypothetical protein